MILTLPRWQSLAVTDWPEVRLHKCWINLAKSTVTHAVQKRFFDKCDIGIFGARRWSHSTYERPAGSAGWVNVFDSDVIKQVRRVPGKTLNVKSHNYWILQPLRWLWTWRWVDIVSGGSDCGRPLVGWHTSVSASLCDAAHVSAAAGGKQSLPKEGRLIRSLS